MHIDRRLVGFGLFLITIGGVMVAVRQGLLPEDAAGHAWRLWPLVLVGVGLSMVLAGRPGAALGGLVLALTFGAIIGGVASTGSFPSGGFCGGDRNGGTAFADAGGDLPGGGSVTIAQDCGDLSVGTVAGSTWHVAGRSADGRPPAVSQTGSTLRIRTAEGGPFEIGAGSAWDVVLPRDGLVDLSIQVNGGQSRLDLAGMNLRDLAIDANAGSVELDLREATAVGGVELDLNFGSATIRLPNRSLTASIEANAGSVALCVPPGAGLRIELDSVAASNDFLSHGLIETRTGWETPGYATAEIRLDLRTDVNAGSLALDPARTCAG
jgi:hypothetical protein